MDSLLSSRRGIMLGGVVLAAWTVVPGSAEAASKSKGIAKVRIGHTPVEQIPLPFAEDALAPVISAKTVGVHYGKHHKTYVDKVALAIKGTHLADTSLEEVVLATARDPAQTALFNMSGQVWNHNFYWQSLTPKAQAPSGKLAAAIERDFGSVDACKKALTDACVGQFGSGWGWLVLERGRLNAVSTSNADTPFLHGQTPLVTVDVWEHAYYLDYQNRRADHVAAVIDKTLNWEFAERNFEEA